MSKLVPIDGGGETNKMRDELRKLQASLETVIEAQQALAVMTRARYDALIGQGFTPAQALELCK